MKKMQNVFTIYYSLGKKTFQIIYQLWCFMGHPVIICMENWARKKKDLKF